MNCSSTVEQLTAFIRSNPTAFHTVNSIREKLDADGFHRLPESRPWKLESGKGYYVTRNGSSIIAFRTSENTDPFSYRIIASHTDSPTFKLKEQAVLKTGDKYSRLNVEGYGGMICYSWFDRPLSVAGRVLIRENNELSIRLLNIDRDLLMIPSVPIHMQRNVNDGFSVNKQVDMLPLLGSGLDDTSFKAIIADALQVSEDSIIGSDLYLTCRTQPAVWGAANEYISAGRLDDQQCVFASLLGFLEGRSCSGVNIFAAFDNEEVGSGTKQGADSTFLHDVLKRIALGLGKTDSEYMAALAGSFMISADNAHAVHPNHPEYYDESNRVYMNEGVVVKSNAAQKYTSDGMSIAILRELASKAEVPLQYFSNRSDAAGGSTLGNIAMSGTSMMCVDIGLPQLAMHSCYETAGVKDTEYLIRLSKELYSCQLEETDMGVLILR